MARSIIDCRRPFHTSTKSSLSTCQTCFSNHTTYRWVSHAIYGHIAQLLRAPDPVYPFIRTGTVLASLSLYHHPANPSCRVPWDSSLSGHILCSFEHEAIRFLYSHRSSLALFGTYVRHSHPRNSNVNRPIPILGISPFT